MINIVNTPDASQEAALLEQLQFDTTVDFVDQLLQLAEDCGSVSCVLDTPASVRLILADDQHADGYVSLHILHDDPEKRIQQICDYVAQLVEEETGNDALLCKEIQTEYAGEYFIRTINTADQHAITINSINHHSEA